jgi:4a-hydroxytetrahydrobiopterin dehydratase
MSMTIALEKNLRFKKCKPHSKGAAPLKNDFVKGYLSQLPDWKLAGKAIIRIFEFKNFYETIGFVNAVAYIANKENHHPDLEVGYKTCKVRYSSHEIDGLSINDFVCATKIDELFNGNNDNL